MGLNRVAPAALLLLVVFVGLLPCAQLVGANSESISSSPFGEVTPSRSAAVIAVQEQLAQMAAPPNAVERYHVDQQLEQLDPRSVFLYSFSDQSCTIPGGVVAKVLPGKCQC